MEIPKYAGPKLRLQAIETSSNYLSGVESGTRRAPVMYGNSYITLKGWKEESAQRLQRMKSLHENLTRVGL